MDERDDAAQVRAPEPEDLVRICRALNEAGARFTKDIDFLIDDDPGNVARVTAALGVLADNAAADVADTDIQTYTTRTIDGVPIPVASPAALIRTKDTYRPQDAVDRHFLEDLLRTRGSGT